MCSSLGAADVPTEQVTPDVAVVRGAVNGVRVTQRGKILAIYGDPRDRPPAAQRVLFTHHRRDVAWAGRALVRQGAEAVVPAAEKALFTEVNSFWERYRTARFHDYSQQTSRVLSEVIPVAQTVRGGENLDWQGLPIEVLDTPGYTRGAVSYLFVSAGKRIACVGDLIYGDGRILDLYSLQDAIPETKEDGYHGYGARAADVISSLRKIIAWKPDVLIPARGPVIRDPRRAVHDLTARLQAVFASHFTIDALRWYRGDDKIRAQARRVLGEAIPQWMPMAETIQQRLPDWIVAISNSRLILSPTGSAFLVDCGSRRIMAQIRELQKQGRFKTLEGIFVTHYHDDHTDQVQAMADEFSCPVFVSSEMRDILEHPAAYRMPAETANPIHALKIMPEGARQRWHEFEFTYSYFPGQTIYHDALLARKDGAGSIFFIGDSFTPSGIDDYCLLNRNFFPPEKGFLYCLDILKDMRPDYLLINEHVPPAFRFSPRQINRMRDNFRARGALLQKLFPWDDPNYGVDEQWARFYPYGSETQPGRSLELKLVIRNHSAAAREYRVTVHAPAGWKVPPGPQQVSIRPREEGFVSIPVTVPADARGLAVLTADVAFGSWDLREWTEALVSVAAPTASPR